MSFARVTVTLPEEIVTEIDRAAPNRSRFVLEAVTRELARRRRAALRTSLGSPHAESLQVAEAGVAEWGRSLPAGDVEGLLDPAARRPVRWSPGKGWKEE